MTTTAPLPPVPLVLEHQLTIRSYLPAQDAQSACLQAVAGLLAFGWTSPCGLAVVTVDQLVRNASEFGRCSGGNIRLRIGITEVDDLLIDVADHNPEFPFFEQAVASAFGQGLRRIAEYGVRVLAPPRSGEDRSCGAGRCLLVTVIEAAPQAAHPLSVHVPEKHVPLRTPEFYAEVVARLRLWMPLPVGLILETLHQVLESPAPPPGRELVHVHWKLRSWHERLSTIATADRCSPPADVLRLVHAGREIGDEPIGDGTQSLGQVRRLASALSDLLDEIARTQGLRVEDEDDEGPDLNVRGAPFPMNSLSGAGCLRSPAAGPVPERAPPFLLRSERTMSTMCKHTPPCPTGDAPDRQAARVSASHPLQGWELLCNGVLLFEDTGQLLPDGSILAPCRRQFAGVELQKSA